MINITTKFGHDGGVTDTFYRLCLSAERLDIQWQIEWVAEHLRVDQELVMEYWQGDTWYLTVRHKNFYDYEYPEGYFMGLTVDFAKDRILWNDDGGNCFCRNRRWKQLLIERFGLEHFAESIHDYKPKRNKR